MKFNEPYFYGLQSKGLIEIDAIINLWCFIYKSENSIEDISTVLKVICQLIPFLSEKDLLSLDYFLASQSSSFIYSLLVEIVKNGSY